MEIKYYLTNKVVFALCNVIGKYILCIIDVKNIPE